MGMGRRRALWSYALLVVSVACAAGETVGDGGDPTGLPVGGAGPGPGGKGGNGGRGGAPCIDQVADMDGTSDCDGDCDDADAEVNPDAEEICDGIDNDCDGSTDGEDATGATTWYEDKDGDGFGISGVTVIACEQPRGYAADFGDCND